MCMHVCVFACVHVGVSRYCLIYYFHYVRVCVRMYVSECVCACFQVLRATYMYACVSCVCIGVCVHMFVYVCMCVCTNKVLQFIEKSLLLIVSAWLLVHVMHAYVIRQLVLNP